MTNDDVNFYSVKNKKKSTQLITFFLETGISRTFYITAATQIHVSDTRLHHKSKNL